MVVSIKGKRRFTYMYIYMYKKAKSRREEGTQEERVGRKGGRSTCR